MRFVLVEDNDVAARGVSMALEAYGHEVMVVDDRRTLIAALESSLPDAVVMDVVLYGEDGVTLSRGVRDRWKLLPIIFTTGREEYPGLPDALLDRNTRYLQKPYDIVELIQTVRDLHRLNDRLPIANRA